MEGKVSLYESLLSDAWSRVDKRVRRLHCRDAELVAHGVFCISPAVRWLGRMMAFVLRLPRAAMGVAVRLQVTPKDGGEEWLRDFNGHKLRTIQRGDPQGRLVERFSGIEFKFRVTERDAGLDFTQEGVSFALWLIRIPIPGWLAPRVVAREEVVGGAVRVEVKVTLPWAGLLIAYEGDLTI